MAAPLTTAFRAAASAFGCSVAAANRRCRKLPDADARCAAYALLYRSGMTHYRVAKLTSRTPTATRKAFSRHVSLMATDNKYRAAFEQAEKLFRKEAKFDSNSTT